MSFQDDVAAIAAEHGMDVAVEYAAQSFDLTLGPPVGDVLRNLWRDIREPLLLHGFRMAASSGADHELNYYTEVTHGV
ncbi:hypothetical protein A5646_03595 [Mycobacterium sp. 1245499.0]|uniref:hypothetical protein n=1 Tax=Mycobacterium sp. 1245499.0 TaxID=1834074 RepID=UPI0007FF2554|nr:hypothetical protein [Mycobacterium sp. 1245499.0]OBK92398.1 hypothetical protein A5646_03595 [Mycobacterium sp. 1245499.0]